MRDAVVACCTFQLMQAMGCIMFGGKAKIWFCRRIKVRDKGIYYGLEAARSIKAVELSYAHPQIWGKKLKAGLLRSFGLASVVGMALSLSACSLTQNTEVFDPPLNSTFSVDAEDVILVAPDQEEREQYQLLIAQLTQLLSQEKLSPERRAQMLYQLGLLYDRMGMDVTARTMFMGSLIAVPDYAQAYNFLGIYLASEERFSEAYEAYDSALEIDPEEYYAYFNRGIALYYGNRAELGLQDLLKFYELKPSDPFRCAWLYILERTVYGKDYAIEHLTERRAKLEDKTEWGLEVLDFFLGKKSSHEVIDAIRQVQLTREEANRRLCEAYFYMAKQAQFEGDYKHAYDLFQLCLTTNVAGYLEYRYSLLEVDRLEHTEDVAKAEQIATEQQHEREAFLKEQAKEAQEYFEKLQEQGQLSTPLAPPASSQPASSQEGPADESTSTSKDGAAPEATATDAAAAAAAAGTATEAAAQSADDAAESSRGGAEAPSADEPSPEELLDMQEQMEQEQLEEEQREQEYEDFELQIKGLDEPLPPPTVQ